VVLFSKVGQIQKLIEGTGNREKFVVAEFAQQVDQALSGSTFLTPVSLGGRPDLFNQLKTLLARMVLNALAQQFTQHSNIFSEFGMQLSHNSVLLN